MKKLIFPVVMSFLLLGSGAAFSSDYEARSGDKELDISLSLMNREAKGDLSGFASRLSLTYGVSSKDVQFMLSVEKMEPADAYFAIRLSKISGRPIDAVLREYKSNKGKGWGVIARNLGIKPGSKEFHELKNGGLRGKESGHDHKGEHKHEHKQSDNGKGKGKNK